MVKSRVCCKLAHCTQDQIAGARNHLIPALCTSGTPDIHPHIVYRDRGSQLILPYRNVDFQGNCCWHLLGHQCSGLSYLDHLHARSRFMIVSTYIGCTRGIEHTDRCVIVAVSMGSGSLVFSTAFVKPGA